MRTFEYRLYPNKEQSCLLMACLFESRTIYNGMLETVKAQYEEKETFPSKYELEAVFKGQGEHIPATTVQMLDPPPRRADQSAVGAVNRPLHEGCPLYFVNLHNRHLRLIGLVC